MYLEMVASVRVSTVQIGRDHVDAPQYLTARYSM
jgi:hypothetical protein